MKEGQPITDHRPDQKPGRQINGLDSQIRNMTIYIAAQEGGNSQLAEEMAERLNINGNGYNNQAGEENCQETGS